MAQREFLDENQIVKFTINKESRAEIEAWAQLVLETGQTWDKQKAYCSIQDFRQINILTPHLRKYASEVNHYFKTLNLKSIHIAIILDKKQLAFILGRLFLEREIRTHGFNRQPFSSEETAILWLRQCRTESNKK